MTAGGGEQQTVPPRHSACPGSASPRGPPLRPSRRRSAPKGCSKPARPLRGRPAALSPTEGPEAAALGPPRRAQAGGTPHPRPLPPEWRHAGAWPRVRPASSGDFACAAVWDLKAMGTAVGEPEAVGYGQWAPELPRMNPYSPPRAPKPLCRERKAPYAIGYPKPIG